MKFDNEDQDARLALISDKLLKALKQKQQKSPNGTVENLKYVSLFRLLSS